MLSFVKKQGSITVMHNYLCLEEIIFDKLHFNSLIFKMCIVVNFQNLKVVHSKKFFWRTSCQGVHTYYKLNYWIRDLLFHPFHFLVFWPLVFENLYGLIWVSCPSNKMCMKKENYRKETIWVFLKTRTKFLWALKFIAEKFISNNWKRNQRSCASPLFMFLPCSR